MKPKSFFIWSVVAIALVAAVTSLTTISLLKDQISAAPYGTGTEGQVNVGGLDTSSVNVIIIDDSVVIRTVAGISDTITFNALRGLDYETGFNAGQPRPFVLRNNGNVRADVKVYSTTQPLFDSPNSWVKFYIAPADVQSGAGWNELDRCRSPAFPGAPLCYDQTGTTCTVLGPCNLPYGADSSVAVNAISKFEFLDANNEAFMHIKIHVGNDEGAGIKWTKLVITGSQSPP